MADRPEKPQTTPAHADDSIRVPLIVAAAFFMETLDASIIVTALPSIARAFGSTTLALSLSISAYLVAVAVFVPAAGWISERYGARNVFAIAIGVFTLASLGCGLSPGYWMFIGSRVLQGSAAAFMSPVGRLVVLRETPKHRLIESLGMIIWPALIGPVVGPPLGGLIATYASWRWIFFINLPIGLVGLWLVMRFIPAHDAGGVRTRFDRVGFFTTAAALVALLQGLSMLAEVGGNRGIGAALVVVGLAVGLLAIRHATRHPSPLLDLTAARHPSFVLSTLTAGLAVRTAIQATPFLLPLMFQIGFGANAFRAGSMVLVYMAGNLMMKAVTTGLLKRHGFRRVAIVNGLLGAVAIAACGLMSPAWSLVPMCVALLSAGMTRSMEFTTLNTLAFVDVPASARPSATTLAAVAQQIGAALGVAFATLALALGQSFEGDAHLSLADFRFAMLACAVLLVIGALWLGRLPAEAGAEATAPARS